MEVKILCPKSPLHKMQYLLISFDNNQDCLKGQVYFHRCFEGKEIRLLHFLKIIWVVHVNIVQAQVSAIFWFLWLAKCLSYIIQSKLI